MKKILSIVLMSLVCLSITGCGHNTKDCMKDKNGDEICIKVEKLFFPYDKCSITKVYKNGKLNDGVGKCAVTTCQNFGNFGYLCRREFFTAGERHNLRGPAVIDFNGSEEYWIYGERYPEGEFPLWSLYYRDKFSLSDQLETIRKQQEEELLDKYKVAPEQLGELEEKLVRKQQEVGAEKEDSK